MESAEPLDDATRKELLASIHQEADRLDRLVNNLLEMTRLESGAAAVRKEWQPLEGVVGAALKRLEPRLREHPVRVDLAPDLPLVPIDAVLIEQVFINILDNAVKYTPRGSPIAIRAATGGGTVTVEIADRGPGFAAGDEERVFEKFYRGAVPGGPGVGLGLAICRAIIATHGGQIWAERGPAGGAVFRFTVPLGDSPPAGPPADD